jgi:hypothetical protein
VCASATGSASVTGTPTFAFTAAPTNSSYATLTGSATPIA